MNDVSKAVRSIWNGGFNAGAGVGMWATCISLTLVILIFRTCTVEFLTESNLLTMLVAMMLFGCILNTLYSTVYFYVIEKLEWEYDTL